MTLKEEHRLGDSLEALYFQTQDWIVEIEFYMEELHFFREVISDKIGSNTIEGQEHKDIYRNIDNMLEHLSEQIKKILKAHENFLFKLIGQNNNERKKNACKVAHAEILQKMSALNRGIKDLKRSLFQYIKDNPFGIITDILEKP